MREGIVHGDRHTKRGGGPLDGCHVPCGLCGKALRTRQHVKGHGEKMPPIFAIILAKKWLVTIFSADFAHILATNTLLITGLRGSAS